MNRQATYVTAVAVGLMSGVCILYYIYRKKNNSIVKLPQKWRKVGTLKHICVYPIKSCGTVNLEKAECTLLGLKNGWLRDRILMVVNNENNFVSARAFPTMVQVQATVRNSVLVLKHKDMEPIEIDLAAVVKHQIKQTAKVWSISVPVYDCGFEPSEWFSRLLDKSPNNYHLVYYASHKSRPLRATFSKSFSKFTADDTGALPDEAPFQLINEASVKDLNTRLQGRHVTFRNFRPNFVLEGAQPYEEDEWKYIKIGNDLIFEILKPCTRCILTTIDQETGIKSADTEPLNTLKSYRQLSDPDLRKSAGSSPKMGIQMALRSGEGHTVSLNDSVYVN